MTTASTSPERPSSKRRRLPRACDTCKRRKIRCDGTERPGNRCTNCSTANIQCTHIQVMKRVGSANLKGYAEHLERRLDRLIALFKKLLPDVDIDAELEDDTVDEADVLERHDDGDSQTASESPLSNLMTSLLFVSPERRFFGKATVLYLIQAVSQSRAIRLGQTIPVTPRSDTFTKAWYDPRKKILTDAYSFPDADLMTTLIDLYFTRHNYLHPLLHRPTFERAFTDGLHLYDPIFGAVVLLVCALGSRWTTDPRVFTKGIDDPGWVFFEQVTLPPPSGRDPAALVDLQLYGLYSICAFFLGHIGTASITLSTAIKMAEDSGAHIQRSGPPNARDELRKRVFWVLITIDIVFGSLMGRANTIAYEDFNVDFPIDCDDQFWEHPDPEFNFKQPECKPSSISFFIQFIKLINILSYVKRLIYPVRQSFLKSSRQHQRTERQIIAEFDSALNEWREELPDHLRWDPKRRDHIHFQQSCFLHITLYYVQIQVHRPYIPMSVFGQPTPSMYPSLEICTDAARSCMRVLDAQKTRGYIEMDTSMMLLGWSHTAALILILNAWRSPPTSYDLTFSEDLRGIQTCLDMLKESTERQNMAWAKGLRNILIELLPDEMRLVLKGLHEDRPSRSREPKWPGVVHGTAPFSEDALFANHYSNTLAVPDVTNASGLYSQTLVFEATNDFVHDGAPAHIDSENHGVMAAYASAAPTLDHGYYPHDHNAFYWPGVIEDYSPGWPDLSNKQYTSDHSAL